MHLTNQIINLQTARYNIDQMCQLKYSNNKKGDQPTAFFSIAISLPRFHLS